MAKSQKTPRKPKNLFGANMRGLSLLEAMLALGIGGIVITQSVLGLGEYTSGIQVQGAASKLAILNRATDRFAEDNYAGLVGEAPREYPISVLEPYTGPNIGEDALGNAYKLTTRRYNITVPDPTNGGTMTETALQVLVVGEYADPSTTPMTEELTLRSDVANTAGSAAGFIAIDELTCSNGAGGTRNNGDICGSFGSYSFPASAFSATNFSNAAIVSLVTKGDSTVYGDQLYRYDYGDPELNTMHTDIHMGDNDLDDVGNITKVTSIDLDGGSSSNAVIRSTDNKTLRLEGNTDTVVRANNGRISLNASNNTYNLVANNVASPPCTGPTCIGDFVNLRAGNGKLRLDAAEIAFGALDDINHGTDQEAVGTGNIWAGEARIDVIKTNEINSLFEDHHDALRLQRDRRGGEVIVGQRVRYNPDGAGNIYQISDGELVAQHVQVQDITCADCGGSLSSILPKWRHMGTYFVGGSGARVPKPNCNGSRTRFKNRPAKGDNVSYTETWEDRRYEPKIIVMPKQLGTAGGSSTGAAGTISWNFRASNAGAEWVASVDTQNSRASALVKTYCVFTGGTSNPATWNRPIPHRDDPSTSDSNFVFIE